MVNDGKKKKGIEEYYRVKSISKKAKVPPYYLGKVLQKLVKKKIIISNTGPRGGFALAKAEKEIFLLDIITAIDGPTFQNSCFMGKEKCKDEACPMHQTWKEAKDKLIKKLKNISLAEIKKLKIWENIYK
jgi:Rrf2 family protein